MAPDPPSSESGDPAEPAVPRWLRVAWFLFMLIWIPVYWRSYGPQNFLWFCDSANLVLTVAMVWRPRLLFSAQASGVLIIQLLWCFDYFGRLLFSVHLIGGTEYMFDTSTPAALRALSFFHLVVPVLLVWALRRFGYDRRAWKVEAPILWASLIPSFCFSSELNLNWAWRPFGFDPGLPAWLWVPLALAVYPALILGITHSVLRFFFRSNRSNGSLQGRGLSSPAMVPDRTAGGDKPRPYIQTRD